METVTAKDFHLSSFKVAINRIQQVALSKVNSKVPCPEDQLALLRTKQGKVERLKLSLARPISYCPDYITYMPVYTMRDITYHMSQRVVAKEVRSC